MILHYVVLGLFLSGTGNAFDIGDFSNDLASDLGPLLSLFGDSMTVQFLSESVTFLDYIIFASAPIGILTALVSVIRLCGSPALRAFIGRSQEGQGAVEAELCTSTSRDVCELFTRGGIQRVLGRPSILELVYTPPSTGAKGNGESELLLSKDYFANQAQAVGSPWKELGTHRAGKGWGDRPSALAPNPNLSLNIGIRRAPNWILWIVALTGVFLQLGVVVLAGVGVWVLDWHLSEGGTEASINYAPAMFIVGTILMCGGIWGCAFLIGQTTHEVRFQKSADSDQSPKTRMFWIQPGPQVIGDQSFDPFAYIEQTDGSNAVRTWTSSKKGFEKHFKLYTYVAVITTLVGYVMQFIGIRGIKAWVSLAQLAITIIMSLLRGALRTQRLASHDNQLRDMPDMVAGHELDWMACKTFPRDNGESYEWHVTGHRGRELAKKDENKSAARSPNTDQKDANIEVKSSNSTDDMGTEILNFRLKLASLTGLHSFNEPSDRQYQVWDDEHVRVRAKARQLALAFGSAVTRFLSNTDIEDDSVRLPLGVSSPSSTGLDRHQFVNVLLRAPPEFSQVGWRVDVAQLEAILGLWMWTMVSDKRVARFDSDYENYADRITTTSGAESVPTARIVSMGVDDATWEPLHNVQGEMNLWLGRGEVKFRQSTVTVNGDQLYNLATLFKRGLADGSSNWEPFNPNPQMDTAAKLQRFSGWTAAKDLEEQALPVPQGDSSPVANSASEKQSQNFPGTTTYRIQHVELASTSMSLLDLACQELYIALMMSLVDLSVSALPKVSFIEEAGFLRLTHPTVDIFAEPFVEYELGHYVDAILCIVPALRPKIPSLDPAATLPALLDQASKYRRMSHWKRAEAVLKMACRRTSNSSVDPKHFEQALIALCELYRWGLAMGLDWEREFGLEGIKELRSTSLFNSHPASHTQEILDRYEEVAAKLEENQVKKLGAERLLKVQSALLEACKTKNRAEALFHLTLLTLDCLRKPSIPAGSLALAARNNWPELISAMLELKADVNDHDTEGKTGLYHSARNGHEECATVLLKHGASLEPVVLKNGKQFGLLSVAAGTGHENVLRLLFNQNCPDVDLLDPLGRTPLLAALAAGHENTARVLIERGVDVNATDHTRASALHFAVRNGWIDMCTLLLDSGARINVRDEMERTPLRVAELGLLEVQTAPRGVVHDEEGKMAMWGALIQFLLDRGGKD